MSIQTLAEQSKLHFLQKHKIDFTEIQSLPKDASNRSYYRIITPSLNYILMDSHLEVESSVAFHDLAQELIANNVKAPKIYSSDLEAGYLLLEDFGNMKFTQYANENKSQEFAIYQTAIDLLISVQDIKPSLILPEYSEAKLLAESLLFAEWFMPYILGKETDSQFNNHFSNLLVSKFQLLMELPKTIVLRDYMADNLMVTSQGLGVLDFQDAVLGNPAYDLVSLLEDARRDVSPQIAHNMMIYYLEKKNYNRQIFKECYGILGLQRNLKILGIFARLLLKNNNSNYLKYLPRVLKYLELDLTQEINRPFAQFFYSHFDINHIFERLKSLEKIHVQ